MRPNRLLVDGRWHVVDDDYRFGALMQRWGTKDDGAARSASFAAGKANELALEHVRFGVDVVSVDPAGRDFPKDPDTRFRRRGYAFHGADYALALMRANGYLEFARKACADNRELPPSLAGHAERVERLRRDGWHHALITPGVLRRRFLESGRMVSREFVASLLSRLRFEADLARVEPLGAQDLATLEAMKPMRRALIQALGDLTFDYWNESPRSQDVSRRVDRSPSWTAATFVKMKADGEDVFLSATRNGYAWLSPAGYAAYAVLVGPERASVLGFAEDVARPDPDSVGPPTGPR